MIRRGASLRSCCCAAVLAALLVGSPPAVAVAADAVEGESGESFDWVRVPEVVFDALILRPLGFAATVGGLPMFVASTPLLAPSGDLLTSWDVFVLAPAEYTFTRPLGDF